MKAFLRGFIYAWRGLRYALTTQRNMKVHLLCTLLAVGISAALQISRLEWMLLCLTLALVMTLEMVNTALEATLDLISREHHPEIGIAKDVAAGAVLIAALFSLCIGALLWGPRLWELLQPFLTD